MSILLHRELTRSDGPRIRVRFHHGTGVVSRLIRWQTRSPVSHVSVQFMDSVVVRRGEGLAVMPRMAVVEAREGVGVRRHDGSLDKPGELIEAWDVDALSVDHYRNAVVFAMDQIGKPYDYTMVARFITRRQATRSTTGKWFCSELAETILRIAGRPTCTHHEPWAVSPGLAYTSLLFPDAGLR